MGIFSAMTTAISGLRTQSFALEQISGNIANSQTLGFKRNETNFVDLVNEEQGSSQVAGSVKGKTRSTNRVQGEVSGSTVGTHMGISGDGYFIVEESSIGAGGETLFSDQNLYTRRGDFEVDRNGFLKNGAGYFLKGRELDPISGNIISSLPSVIKISNDFLPARRTTEVIYRANLAVFPLTATADRDVPGSEFLRGPFGSNPTTQPIYYPAQTIGGISFNDDLSAQIKGSGAMFEPDQAQVIVGKGVFDTSEKGGFFTVNGITVNYQSGNSGAEIAEAVTSAMGDDVSAYFDSEDNRLILTASDADVTINLSGFGLAAVGLDKQETIKPQINLLTQGLSQNDILIIRAGTNENRISFGSGSSQISTINELESALDGLVGVNAANDEKGNISLVALENNKNIIISGTVQPNLFGLQSIVRSSNEQISGLNGLLEVTVGNGQKQLIDLRGVRVRNELLQSLQGLAGVKADFDAGGRVRIVASNNMDVIKLSGEGALELGITTASPIPEEALNGYVTNQDTEIFLNQSIDGGSIVIFNDSGEPVDLQLRWGKLSEDPGNWNLFYKEQSNPLRPEEPVWRNIGMDYTFDSSGDLLSSFGTPIIKNMEIDGISIGRIQFDHGRGGLSQFSTFKGTTRLTEISHDGYAAGELTKIGLSENGHIQASYTNGRSLSIAEVSLASFNNPNGLQKIDGGSFLATDSSGEALFGSSGKIEGQSLEGSNTDVADEFTKLLVTQQAYAAGTRIISTGNEMLQEALNMIR
ncbi:MAG: flagellar hook-basal body complex protein [Alphaproteobacteria bacterium]|nr:flagellar hook-basal body complex protein [Alphaproteobacteria bacterium]